VSIVLLPEAEPIVRAYLAATPEVTALVPANRIQTERLTDGITWPAIRITNVAASLFDAPEWINAAQVQVDCFDTSDAAASLAARTVHGALVEMRDQRYTHSSGQVVGVDFVLGPMSQPDETRDPPLARWLIRAVVNVSPLA
jgi:hypothetical protein